MPTIGNLMASGQQHLDMSSIMEQSVLVEDTLEIATEIPKMSLGPGTVILCDLFCIKLRRCHIVKARVLIKIPKRFDLTNLK